MEGHFARQVVLLRYNWASERTPILPLGNQWKKMVCTGGDGWPAPIILSGPKSHPKWASQLRPQVALDCSQKHKSFRLILTTFSVLGLTLHGFSSGIRHKCLPR